VRTKLLLSLFFLTFETDSLVDTRVKTEHDEDRFQLSVNNPLLSTIPRVAEFAGTKLDRRSAPVFCLYG